MSRLPAHLKTARSAISELGAAYPAPSIPSDEFQIPNDAESLRPSGQRFADIILGTEPPEDFSIHQGAYGEDATAPPSLPGAAGVDSVDVLLGDDYASLIYRDVSSSRRVEPPPVEETVFAQIAYGGRGAGSAPPTCRRRLQLPPFEQQSLMPPPAEPGPGSAADLGLPWMAPIPDSEPAPEAAAEPEPEHEPEPIAVPPEPAPIAMVDDYVPLGDLGAPSRFQPAAPQAEEQEPATAAEPELVVTETMAEIFLRQGHRELALAVYAQLAQREPDNERIAAALASLILETPRATDTSAAPARGLPPPTPAGAR